MDTPKAEIDRDGRLIAHRLILETLLREVAAQSDDPERFWGRFAEFYTFQDHEEDPGVVPTEAYGIEATAAQEVRRLVEAARSRGQD